MPEPDRRSKFSGLPTPMQRLRPPQIHACRSGIGPERQIAIRQPDAVLQARTAWIGPRGQITILPAEARPPAAPRPDPAILRPDAADQSPGRIADSRPFVRSVLQDRSSDSFARPRAPPNGPPGQLRRFPRRPRRPRSMLGAEHRPLIGPSGQIGDSSAIQRRAARMAATTSGPSERPSHSASANTPCHSSISSPSWTRAPAASARSSRPPVGRG
jgi:hypothetical protein